MAVEDPKRRQSRTGLLSLPLEIRLEIYSYLLQLPRRVSYTEARTSSYTGHHPYIAPKSTYYGQDIYSKSSTTQKQDRTPAKAPKKCCRSEDCNHPELHAAVLQTNRQINHEATPLLYTSNTFVAHPSLLASFPRLRGWYSPVRESAVASRIRRFYVQVSLDSDLPFTEEAAARSFSDAEELTVYATQCMFMGAGCENLRCFEGVKGVKLARIEGSTTGFEEYARWLERSMMSEKEDDVEDFRSAPPSWTDSLVLARA